MSRKKTDDPKSVAESYGLPPGFYIDALHGLVDGPSVARLGNYVCPSCGINMSRKRDVRWLQCPLLENEFICTSCCRCFQGVVRSSRFDTHPDLEWFTKVAEHASGAPADAARISCANHALAMAREILRTHEHAADEGAFYRELVERLEAVAGKA